MEAEVHLLSDVASKARLARERDLYKQLLSLGACKEIEPLLDEALAMVVDATGAQQAVIEVYADASEPLDASWWLAHGCSDAQARDIRGSISHGIVACALASGETVSTCSALNDPRFRDRASVHRERIGAVLCAPIGGDASLGVLYLQGIGSFLDDDREIVELFARHLEPFVDRLRVRRIHAVDVDHTRAVREVLRSERIIGRSAALRDALTQASLVAPLDVNVLLLGDSGTGKSHLASVIHENSPRSGRPFVELNCAALPEALIESELFGARAGAHSTAARPITGKVAAAEGGTLFLDEIGELPVQSQAKLLQLLQSKHYYPLGAHEPLTADVRVLAASNRDLQDAVRRKTFREDLFFRLQVLPIRLPTLAERVDDIPLLAANSCREVARRHGLPQLELSPAAVLAVKAAEWPGNVRQLVHSVEAAVIRAAGERSLRVERRHVFPECGTGEDVACPPDTFQDATRVFQRSLVERTLEELDWNVAASSRRLDITRSHLYNLIRAFGLTRRPS